MQVEEITQILRESPSVRLIKSRSVDFFLSFVIEAFEGQAAIMQERLHMLLENRLDEQENTLVEDDSEMTRLVESNEQKVSIRPRACFFPLFSFLPLWLHYNLNPLCVQY